MKLFLLKTEKVVYATNGETSGEVLKKFRQIYDERPVLEVKEIPVESLVELEDNDSIIFF